MQGLVLPPLYPSQSQARAAAAHAASPAASSSGSSTRRSSSSTAAPSADGKSPRPYSIPQPDNVPYQQPLGSSQDSRRTSSRSGGADAPLHASRSPASSSHTPRSSERASVSSSPAQQQQQEVQQEQQQEDQGDQPHQRSSSTAESGSRTRTGSGGGGGTAGSGAAASACTGGAAGSSERSPQCTADNAAAMSALATPQTTLALQQAALRRDVQRDIKRMLAGNRAYQRAVHGPPTLSAESLAQLAKPKQRGGEGLEAQVAADLLDPVDWAVWKTEQLAISRMTEERRAAKAGAEKRSSAEALARFKQRKAEAEQAKAEAQARAAAEEAAYRATMSAYLNHRGALELEDFRKRREGERERLALQRSRNTKGVGAHHY